MKKHEIEYALLIPRPQADVFAFFAEPRNLELITPPELRFKILSPLPILMEPGTRIEYRIKLFGISTRWTSLITLWDPPNRFVDEQAQGLYASWIHLHKFEETASGTIIRDLVHFSLPIHPFGEVAHPFVRRQLEQIFSYRKQAVRRALLIREDGYS